MNKFQVYAKIVHAYGHCHVSTLTFLQRVLHGENVLGEIVQWVHNNQRCELPMVTLMSLVTNSDSDVKGQLLSLQDWCVKYNPSCKDMIDNVMVDLPGVLLPCPNTLETKSTSCVRLLLIHVYLQCLLWRNMVI